MQTRVIDALDKELVLHAVMATLQDLGFVIDDANDMIGTVTATKMDKYQIKMTVSVRKRGNDQFNVRANAQYNLRPITDPEPYRQFFTALDKGKFLTVNQFE